MAIRIPKSGLLSRFDEAIGLSGWNLLYRSKSAALPARYTVWRDDIRFRVNVYIWNITPGGRPSLPHEYRIQRTGAMFVREPGARTLVLGYWADIGVFAGWDVRQHTGSVGESPSLQISDEALYKASTSGFAPYIKGNGETAIALNPEFMGTYIENLEALHDSGRLPKEFKVLEHISDDPDDVDEEEIESQVAEKRKRALISTWKNLRASDFGRRVLTAYSNRCAMCGVQLRLIEGAHILPVGEDESTDTTSNGVALCVLHHRSYDRGLVTFDKVFKTHFNETMIDTLEAADLAGGLGKFRKALRPIISLPPDKKDRPNPKLVDKANTLRGWKL